MKNKDIKNNIWTPYKIWNETQWFNHTKKKK